MENQIKNLDIQNFKSIKHLQMDCKRVNILIGEPNVGKSNILEALSLLGAGYETNYKKYLSSFIRYENFNNLFYDKDLTKDIRVTTDDFWGLLHCHNNNMNTYSLAISKDSGSKVGIEKTILGEIYTVSKVQDILNENFDNCFYKSILSTGEVIDKRLTNFTFPIRKYDFKTLKEYANKFPIFLLPPFGDNLFAILDGNSKIQEESASFFEKYGLKLRFNTEQNKLEIQKEVGNRVYIYPYSGIADTLQRIIFYLAAIESNKNSVLLFEEPESHSFPPYVGMLADRIAQDEDNQYFIATHSPYLLSMIEKIASQDLNVIITYFEDYETKIKILTHDEVREIIDYGIDAFYNLDRFLSNETSYEN